ncbi:uncharacterized protein LOC132313064 isoform X2 [Cornus florida]|uniref:uncharacterized protein LOC132313064 isoform X2 n=1 Tax=Cornus florida TaxID=4283 RepID=UPI0028A189FD|nr:uncharacterized protein LOC132313064 isoform X2 [Cornus florida]
MWQVLLAAAVAGSGFFAKRVLTLSAEPPITESEQTQQKCDQSTETQHSDEFSLSQVSIPFSEDHSNETQSSVSGESSSIFRFSSPGKNGSRFGSKNLGKKSRGIRGNVKGFKGIDVGNVEKECGFVDGGDGVVMDQTKSVKRFPICLKKRRTSKNAIGKYESCSSKGFGWGLGIGMMYMMSAGKAEISRLNTAMDETARVVQELKTELSKRKSSHLRTEGIRHSNKIRGKHAQTVVTKSSTKNGDDTEVSGLPSTEEGEYASSVLTEEPPPELLEMDQLEAELESELQKLPWCTEEVPCFEERSNICETEALAKEFIEPDGQTSYSNPLNGVLPSELDQKLSRLLIEQQESQIVELESELHQAHFKLHEKEAELQALKDCVKRLTEFSLATASDEETEIQVEKEKKSGEDYDKKMVFESKKSTVGMKRAMDFESYK